MKKIFLLIFLALFLFSSCSKLETAGYEVGSDLGAKLIGDDEEETIFELLCLESAQEQVIEPITLLFTGKSWFIKEYTFADGTVDNSVSIRYRSGEDEGENINYYYPSNVLEDDFLFYSKQQIAEDGTIKGDFEFKVSFILKKTDEPSQIINSSKYGKNIESQTFSIVEADYESCVLP